MFVVVTLLVALGIALVQGCQGPSRGLGGDGGGARGQREQVHDAAHGPPAQDGPPRERYVSAPGRDG